MAGNGTDARRSVISKLSMILLAFSQGGAYTVTELAEHTGLPVSTTHRLATELVQWRVLERNDDRRFRPGLSLRTLGGTTCCTVSIRDRAAPALEDLSRATGAATRLGLLDHRVASYIYTEPDQPVSQFSPAATLPLHATALGKVLLAFAPQDVLDATLPARLRAYTPHTITDPDRFRWVLKLARAHRMAIDDRELLPDYAAVAAPVFGVGGNVVAALEIQVDDISNVSHSRRSALIVAAGSLSRELERPCCECSERNRGPSVTTGFPTTSLPGPRSLVPITFQAREPDIVANQTNNDPIARDAEHRWAAESV